MHLIMLLLRIVPFVTCASGIHNGYANLQFEADHLEKLAMFRAASKHCLLEVQYRTNPSGSYSADLLVPPEAHNVKRLIEEQYMVPNLASSAISDHFLPLEQIERYLSEIESSYSDLVKIHRQGLTHENRSLSFVQIGNCTTCPAIFVEAGIHAREWLAHAVALNIIDKLLTDYSNRTYTKELTWFILPVANPDGYALTHSSPQYRLWRKNRRPPIEGEECSGVDLNRNFKYDWGGEEADDDPESLNYPGPAAESEPETKAIIEFINSHSSQIRAYVALHTAGQKLMYPCPPGRSSCFEENREVAKLASDAAAAIKAIHGKTYQVGSSENVNYYAAGTSVLWALHEKHINFSYTIELRPVRPFDSGPQKFMPEPNEIKPTSEEIWAAFDVIAKFVVGKYKKL